MDQDAQFCKYLATQMRRPTIGIMGPGELATERDQQLAYQLGQQIAQQQWIVLTGGRAVGVMEAASRGAQQAGGLTIGILPGEDASVASTAVEIVIPTGIGHGRNLINVLASQVVVACGMGSGTASEVALALKVGKPVILLNCSAQSQAFFQALAPQQVNIAIDTTSVIEQIQQLLQQELPINLPT